MLSVPPAGPSSWKRSRTSREVSFKDRDFEFLFDPGKDGAVEDPDLQTQMGFVNLRFADWFSPFWEDEDPFSPI